MTYQEKSEYRTLVEAEILKDAVGAPAEEVTEMATALGVLVFAILLLLVCLGGLFSVFLDALNFIFN
tara:strand:+ start:277 stop:477 length:201 start_codon:yes stop_codon:yes gene_type:complete